MVEEYRSLTAEAESDGNIDLVFPSEAPEVETLDMVRMLADAMSALGLSDVSWKQAATFLTQSADVEKSASALRQAFIAAAEAWRASMESLQLDAAVFLDGGQHETTGTRSAPQARPGSPGCSGYAVVVEQLSTRA